MKKEYCFLFLLFVFISCETVVKFNVDTQENKLVVNSNINADSGIVATVSLSKKPLDEGEEFTLIDDAAVQLFESGNYVGTLASFGYGKYIFNSIEIENGAGKTFELQVEKDTYDMVTAQTSIPQKPVINSFSVSDTILQVLEDSSHDYKLTITFTDISFADELYALRLFYSDISSYYPVCFSTFDKIFNNYSEGINAGTNADALTYFCDETTFSDATFNGQTKTLVIYISYFDAIFFPGAKFIAELSSLSNDYYQYINTSRIQDATNGNPFAQPVIVYSNVQGGFGIFGGSNSTAAEAEL